MQPTFRRRRATPPLALVALLAGAQLSCGGDSTGPGGGDPRKPASIAIVPVADTRIFIGLTLQLRAVVIAVNGDTLDNAPITWSSGTPAGATVTSLGLVTGIEHGTVVITAASGGLTDNLAVQVIHLATYSYSPVDTTLDANQVIQYTITGQDVLGVVYTNLPLVWTSSAPTFATVSQTGQVTAMESNGGTAIITFTLGFLFGNLNVVVAPAPVASVTVSSGSVWAGDSLQLTYQLKAVNGTVLTNRPVSWLSSDPLTASVNQAGVVTAHKGGSVLITVLSELVAGNGNFTVNVLPAFVALTEGDKPCGLFGTGDLYCWSSVTGFPTLAASGFQFTQAGTTLHGCGLTAGGNAYCWGRNTNGQLGDGTTTDRTTPVPVAGGLTFTQITVGNAYTCGVTAAGPAYCWGLNQYGQLGNATTQSSPTPVPVSGGLNFVQLSASLLDNRSTCGVTTGNEAWCWGGNLDGQLGTGDSVSSLFPRQVIGGISFQAVTVNDYHGCGISLSLNAYCWGHNRYGNVGDGGTVSSVSPQLVIGGSYTSVMVGYLYTCGLAAGNEPRCWGNNSASQLGDGSTQAQQNSPVTIGTMDFTQVVTKSGGGCGLASTGKIYCWGGVVPVPTLMKGQEP